MRTDSEAIRKETRAKERTLAFLKLRLDRVGINAPSSLSEEILHLEEEISELKRRLSHSETVEYTEQMIAVSEENIHEKSRFKVLAKFLLLLVKVIAGIMAIIVLIYIAIQLDPIQAVIAAIVLIVSVIAAWSFRRRC